MLIQFDNISPYGTLKQHSRMGVLLHRAGLWFHTLQWLYLFMFICELIQVV